MELQVFANCFPITFFHNYRPNSEHMKRPITNLVIGLLAFFATQLAAQPTFTLSPTTITANQGDIITVNVVVTNFTNIVSFQYSMNWNPAVLQFNPPVGGLNLAGLTTASFGTNQASNGILTTSWIDPNATGVTVPSGTVIYTLSFTVLSTTGATIAFSNSPTVFEVVDGNGQIITANTTFVPTQVNGGSGSGGGGGGGGGGNPPIIGFAVYATDKTVASGAQACVNVKVLDFTDIVSMQYTMEFDESKWQYSSVQGFNLAGLSAANFGVNQVSTGRISFSWLDPNTTGVTLTDSTTIYQVCLNAIGANACGSTTPFQFNGSLTSIEVVDADGNNVPFQSDAGDLEICNTPGGGGGTGGGGGGTGGGGTGGGGTYTTLTFVAGEVESPTSSQICVDFKAYKFNCVVSAQFSIHFNQSIIQYLSAQSFGLPDLTAANFGSTQAANGTISFSWFDQSTTGITVPDGTTIFQLCFNVTGTNGQVSNITFDANPTAIEVTGCTNGQTLTPSFDPGSVTVGVTCSGPVTISNNVITHVACPGGTTGAINITTAGGSAIKTYAWSNGANTEDVSGLAAGTYTVTVTSCAGTQTTTSSFVVNSTNTAIVINNQTADVQCFGETNGSVDITVTGGTTTGTGCSAYAFSWSNGATTQDISGVSAGNYTVTVTDCNGCQKVSAVFEVKTSTSLLTLNETHTNVSCNGAANGTITAAATGGGNTKEYRLGNGTWGANPVFTGLTAGNYNIQVRDNFGCVKTIPVSVTQPNAISVSSTATPSTTGSNGSINVSVTGGTSPYTYSWSGPSGPVPGNPEDPSGLAPGTYCVTVTDANSCTKSHCKQVDAPAIADNASTFKNTCFNTCNGEIDVNVTGGIAPFTYSWTGSGSPTGDHPTGLCAGNYAVTVTSSNSGPTATFSFTLTSAASAPGAAFAPQLPSSSAACDGRITLSPTGGSGSGYTYLWSNGQTGNPAIALCEGSFTVTITDSNGCTGTAGPFTLDYVPPVLGNAVVNPSSSCANQSNGQVVLSINGGTPPYNYQLTGGGNPILFNQGNSVTFSGLPAGNYSYTITDSGIGVDKQTKTGTFAIGEIVLTLSQEIVTHTTSSTGGGKVDIEVAGGSTASYLYQWNNGATSQDLFNVAPGCYSVTVTSVQGQCVASFSNIGVGLLKVDIDAVKPACAQDLGSITATPSISPSCAVHNLPYTYDWENAQGENIGTQATLNNVVAGIYYVTVSDNGGTGVSSVSIELSYELTPESNLSVTAEVTSDFNGFGIQCYGSTNGSAKAFASNGANNIYNYVWSNGATSQAISGLAAGNYTVSVTDGELCIMTATVTLTQPQPLTTQVSESNSGCSSENTGQATVIVGGGVPPYSYLWSNGATTQTATGLEAGKSYSVIITDFNGCTMNDNAFIEGGEQLGVNGFSVPDSGGPNGEAGVEVIGGTWPYEFVWQDYPDATDSVLTELFPGEYLVLVTDANGCQKALVIIVGDETLCGEVRAVITPEGDGKNEEFKIQCLSRFNDNTLEIFNRWGQLVYRTEDYNDGDLWRGTTNRGEDLPDGVYYYVFNYFDPAINVFITKKGSVTVLRK